MSRLAGMATVLYLGAASAGAQLQHSVVSGRVLAADGSPVARAEVALRDTRGQTIAGAVSDEEGRFRLRGVAPGDYHLAAVTQALQYVADLHRRPFATACRRNAASIERPARCRSIEFHG